MVVALAFRRVPLGERGATRSRTLERIITQRSGASEPRGVLQVSPGRLRVDRGMETGARNVKPRGAKIGLGAYRCEADSSSVLSHVWNDVVGIVPELRLRGVARTQTPACLTRGVTAKSPMGDKETVGLSTHDLRIPADGVTVVDGTILALMGRGCGTQNPAACVRRSNQTVAWPGKACQ
jgi:hypothetical protein